MTVVQDCSLLDVYSRSEAESGASSVPWAKAPTFRPRRRLCIRFPRRLRRMLLRLLFCEVVEVMTRSQIEFCRRWEEERRSFKFERCFQTCWIFEVCCSNWMDKEPLFNKRFPKSTTFLAFCTNVHPWNFSFSVKVVTPLWFDMINGKKISVLKSLL